MDGLKKILQGKQQTEFLLLSFILTTLCCTIGYGISARRAEKISAEINNVQLGEFGIVAQYIRESGVRNADSVIEELAARMIAEPTEEQIAMGESALIKYGYSSSMDVRFSMFYETINSGQNEIFIGICVITALLISSAGALMFSCARKNLSEIAMYAGRVFDTGRSEKDNPFCGSAGLLHSTITTMGIRFYRMLEALNTEKQYLKIFISNISHQMKTPIAVLRMNNELMENPDMTASERMEFLRQSEIQLGRLEWLVTGQLRQAKLDADVVDFNFIEQELYKTATIATDYFRDSAERKNISLQNNIPRDIMLLHDREWLAEAICNIIKNALEYTPSGGKIEITADETPLTVGLYISDNGKGISAEALPHIFERFYTSGSGIGVSNVGIGLSLSKSIFEKHNARITAESTEGSGTLIRAIFLK